MAVYPAQGVTEVTSIETLEISGFTNQFYVLRCLDSEKKIRVPVANVAQVGLRSVVDQEQICMVLGVLRSDQIAIDEPNWNRRYRRYVEKIQSGNLGDVAQVLRDLHLVKGDKQLSYGERRVYEMAHQLLVQELAVAQGLDEEAVRVQVESLLG
jgi:CarD family transcriptional regulator